jgi:hypothetical protein
MSNRPRTLGSPVAKLAVFGVGLAAALGGGLLVGATVGPEPSDDTGSSAHDAGHQAETSTSPASGLPDGLAISRDGYTLDLQTPVVPAGRLAELALEIEGPDGHPLTDYDVESEKELHLVIVGRDLTGYAHVHPAQDDDGVWTVTAPAMAPGSYRVFADFVPAGGDRLTLGADLTVPGDHRPAELPPASTETTVDGYHVSFDGELVAGVESELTVTVTHEGEPVSDLEPYLGSLGHLVVIRDGDLAYLHVHPLEEADRPGGPSVRFAVEVPTDGTYGLIFDFSHGDEVRTAAIVTTTTGVEHS